MLYTDLNFKSGSDNMGGTPIVAWAIPYDQIFKLPSFKANPANMDIIQIIYKDIIPKAYRTFYKIYATSDTGKVDDNKLDGKDSGSYESVYEFFFPKNDKNALGFMRMSASKWIFVVQESDGNMRILGIQQGMPATIKNIGGTTGTLTSGDKGATFQVRSLQNGPAPIYLGKLNLDRDSHDLSKYPMIFNDMRVTSYSDIGYPLTIEYYYDTYKLFTWYNVWNSQNQLVQRNVVINAN